MSDCPYKLQYAVHGPALTTPIDAYRLGISEVIGTYSDYDEAMNTAYKILKEKGGTSVEILLYGRHPITTENESEYLMFKQEILSLQTLLPKA